MAKSLAILLKDAATLLDRYDFGSALELYRQALSSAPNNAAAAMGMAMAMNRTGRPAEALELLRKVWNGMAVTRPRPAPARQASVLAQIGISQEQLGNLADALETYRHAGRLISSHDLRERIRHLEPLANSPAPVQQLILNARKLQSNRLFEESARTFRAALQLQPDNAEVLHGLALVLRALGQPMDAIPLLQKATILAPDRAEYFNDLGLLFHDRSDFSKALSFHKRASKIDPRLLSAWINAGVAHKRLGQHDDSENAYRQALKIDPRSAPAHNNLGNLLRATGRLTQARHHLRRALALAPDYPDAAMNLAAVTQALAQARQIQPGRKHQSP